MRPAWARWGRWLGLAAIIGGAVGIASLRRPETPASHSSDPTQPSSSGTTPQTEGHSAAAPSSADGGITDWSVRVIDYELATPLAGAKVSLFLKPKAGVPPCPCPPRDSDLYAVGDRITDGACDCEAAALALVDLKVPAPVPEEEVLTDSDGKAQLHLPADIDLYAVRVAASGHQPLAESYQSDDEVYSQTIRLRAAMPLRLSFVDEDGQPVQAVKTSLFGLLPMEAFPLRNEDGVWVADGVPDTNGDVLLAVTAPGFRAEKDELDPTRSKASAVGLITLSRPRRVRGRVTGPKGAVAGAEVETDQPDIKPVTTNAQGHFAIENLSAQSRPLLTARMGHLAGYAYVEHLDSEREEEVDIAMVPTASLTITLLESTTRKPISDAEMKVESSEYDQPPSKPEAGEPGVYFLADTLLREGTLRIEAAGYPPVERDLELKPGEDAHLEVLLEPGLTLRGRVSNLRGEPIPEVEVELQDKPTSVTLPFTATGTTDQDGRFAVEGLPRGPMRLTMGVPGYAGLDEEIEIPAAERAWTLPSRATLDGHVLDATGRTVSAQLTLDLAGRSELEQPPQARADADGGFLFPEVAEGHGVMEIEATAEGIATRTPVILHPGTNHLDLHVDPGGTLAGVVTGADGKPVVGARVEGGCQPEAPSAPSAPQPTATSDDQGRFTLMGLPPNASDCWLRASADRANSDTLAHLSAGATGLELKLESRFVLTGRVVSSSGAPALDFTVGGAPVHDSDGNFRVWVAPGQSEVLIAGPFVARSIAFDGPATGNVDLGDIVMAARSAAP